jgi:hypothetical protein
MRNYVNAPNYWLVWMLIVAIYMGLWGVGVYTYQQFVVASLGYTVIKLIAYLVWKDRT